MPIPPNTPLLDIEIRTTYDEAGRQVKILSLAFGALRLSSSLDEGQVNELLRQLLAGKEGAHVALPITDMRPLKLPKHLRAQPLTPEVLNARRMPDYPAEKLLTNS